MKRWRQACMLLARVRGVAGDLTAPLAQPLSLEEKRRRLAVRKACARSQETKFTRVREAAATAKAPVDASAGSHDLRGTPPSLVAEARRRKLSALAAEVEKLHVEPTYLLTDRHLGTKQVHRALGVATTEALTADECRGDPHQGLVSEDTDSFALLDFDESLPSAQSSAKAHQPDHRHAAARDPPASHRPRYAVNVTENKLCAAHIRAAIGKSWRHVPRPTLEVDAFSALPEWWHSAADGAGTAAVYQAAAAVKNASRGHAGDTRLVGADFAALCSRIDQAATELERRLALRHDIQGAVTPADAALVGSITGLLHELVTTKAVDVELFRRCLSVISCIAALAINNGCVVDFSWSSTRHQEISARQRIEALRAVLNRTTGWRKLTSSLSRPFQDLLASLTAVARAAQVYGDIGGDSHRTVITVLETLERFVLLDVSSLHVSAAAPAAGDFCIVVVKPISPSLLELHTPPRRALLDQLLSSRIRDDNQMGARKLLTGLVALSKDVAVARAKSAGTDSPVCKLQSSTFLGCLARAVARHSAVQPTSCALEPSSQVPDAYVVNLMFIMYRSQCVWPGTRTFLRLCASYLMQTEAFTNTNSEEGNEALSTHQPLFDLPPNLMLKASVAIAGVGVPIPMSCIRHATGQLNAMRVRGRVDASTKAQAKSAFSQLAANKGNRVWRAKLRAARNAATTATAAGEVAGSDSPGAPFAGGSGNQETTGSVVRPDDAFTMIRLSRADPFEAWGLEVSDGSMALSLRSSAASAASGDEAATPAAVALRKARCPHDPARAASLDLSRCRLLAVDGVAVSSASGAKRAMFGALSVGLHVAVAGPIR
jgi:hypothetical protein